MNVNNLYTEAYIRFQQERVQEEMKRIRLEEEALKGRPHPPLLPRLRLLVQNWVEARKNRPVQAIVVEHPVKI